MVTRRCIQETRGAVPWHGTEWDGASDGYACAKQSQRELHSVYDGQLNRTELTLEKLITKVSQTVGVARLGSSLPVSSAHTASTAVLKPASFLYPLPFFGAFLDASPLEARKFSYSRRRRRRRRWWWRYYVLVRHGSGWWWTVVDGGGRWRQRESQRRQRSVVDSPIPSLSCAVPSSPPCHPTTSACPRSQTPPKA